LKANDIHIWMNIPSFHQNDLFNELNKQFEKFMVVYARTCDLDRQAQGWQDGNIQHYESKIIGKDLKIWQLARYVFQNRKATHIVNGIWLEPSFFMTIVFLNIFGANFFIYSEAPNPSKKRTIFKKITLALLVKPIAKLLIFRAKGVLAVSEFAVEHFKSLGVKSERIYRFGYFRNIQKVFTKPQLYPRTKLIFVGQLIERKGVQTLLKAIKQITEKRNDFHLTIIGKGELEPTLRNYIECNQLQKLVNFQGIIMSENVTNYISKADLLILPSLFDGWGMVINEALLCDVPVLVSDQCGAKELITDNHNGLIFRGNDEQSLSEKLLNYLDLPLENKKQLKRNASRSGKLIEMHQVAAYLKQCVSHALNPNLSKINAPWLNNEG
jgi:glycosyltransferase involved in cell wall biosynthesis